MFEVFHFYMKYYWMFVLFAIFMKFMLVFSKITKNFAFYKKKQLSCMRNTTSEV